MAFQYQRTIRFHETDAAGVVYFANALTLCHEAYEASLAESGFNLGKFFSTKGSCAVPIIHTQSDFFQPLRCGDNIIIFLTPTQLTSHSFEIAYQIYRHPSVANKETDPKETDYKKTTDKPTKADKSAVNALTRHLCINPETRQRQGLPADLLHWIEAFGALL